jgi:hypothetical protein
LPSVTWLQLPFQFHLRTREIHGISEKINFQIYYILKTGRGGLVVDKKGVVVGGQMAEV